MSTTKEDIKITDRMGFIYSVRIEHTPHHGFSTAYYEGRIIGQCELGRILEPFSDDDREWEMYEELFGEWRDSINSNLTLECKQYFNNQLSNP